VLGTQASVSRYGSVNRPAQEYDINVFGQLPGDDIAQDTWHNLILDLGPYVFAEFVFGPITITPGLRLDSFVIDRDRVVPKSGTPPPVGFSRLEWALDPRLQITYKPIKRLSVTLSSGIYHQAPEPEDLGAVFGNPSLGLLRAIHVSLGGQVRLIGTLSLE